jgi:hypothetical protein
MKFKALLERKLSDLTETELLQLRSRLTLLVAPVIENDGNF